MAGHLIMNCHGCKWLDRYKEDGRGYCCMVVRSKSQSSKIRMPDMERCERYKPGDFKTRWETERQEQLKGENHVQSFQSVER